MVVYNVVLSYREAVQNLEVDHLMSKYFCFQISVTNESAILSGVVVPYTVESQLS